MIIKNNVCHKVAPKPELFINLSDICIFLKSGSFVKPLFFVKDKRQIFSNYSQSVKTAFLEISIARLEHNFSSLFSFFYNFGTNHGIINLCGVCLEENSSSRSNKTLCVTQKNDSSLIVVFQSPLFFKHNLNKHHFRTRILSITFYQFELNRVEAN